MWTPASTPQTYTLPLLELGAAVEAAAGAGAAEATTGLLTFQALVPGGVMYKLDALGIHQRVSCLKRATCRSVLSFGLFSELGSGEDVASVVAQAATAEAMPAGVHSWRAGVVALGAGKGEEGPLIEALRLCLTATGGLGLDPAKEIVDERVSPDLDLFLFLLPAHGASRVAPSHQQRLLLGRRLAKGPAVGRGYTYAETPRRPKAGVLRFLAQQRQAHQALQTPTAMEPEIALAMATLAGVRRGSRVLDVFLGGGSILFAAGLLGAGELVGTDAAAELVGEGTPARAAAMEAFAALAKGPVLVPAGDEGEALAPPLRPPMPALFVADIREFAKEEHAAIFRPDHYDAICTDPPYAIKERVRGATVMEGREREDVAAIIQTLLRLAAHVLRPCGGRLVFFLPVWGRHGMEAGEKTGSRGRKAPAPPMSLEDDGPPLSSSELRQQWHSRILAEQASTLAGLPALGLRLVSAQPQVFSPTFFRWLLCIEKL